MNSGHSFREVAMSILATLGALLINITSEFQKKCVITRLFLKRANISTDLQAQWPKLHSCNSSVMSLVTNAHVPTFGNFEPPQSYLTFRGGDHCFSMSIKPTALHEKQNW